jgi:XTP/dITP diphosphohydrolase
MSFVLPKKILIATNNSGKFIEISDLLKTIAISSVSAAQFHIEEPEETGLTYAENSLLKAKYYGLQTKLFAIADDSGLSIDALDGEPGIHSARWAIDQNGNKNFTVAFEEIAKKLQEKNIDLYHQKVPASFICNLCLFDPQTNFHINFEGKINGTITLPPKGDKGFGYDPIFTKGGYSTTFGEIENKEKNKISHRTIAFTKMLEWLRLSK